MSTRSTPPGDACCPVSSTPTCTSASARRRAKRSCRCTRRPPTGRSAPRSTRRRCCRRGDHGVRPGRSPGHRHRRARRHRRRAGPGPRFAAAGRQITTQQGIGDTLPAPLGDLPTAFGVVVRGHDDIVQEIRDEVKEGVDLVKIAGSGPGTEEHGAFDSRRTRCRRGRGPSPRQADRHPRAAAAPAVADAVAAGFDWIMHASFMDAATLDGCSNATSRSCRR